VLAPGPPCGTIVPVGHVAREAKEAPRTWFPLLFPRPPGRSRVTLPPCQHPERCGPVTQPCGALDYKGKRCKSLGNKSGGRRSGPKSNLANWQPPASEECHKDSRSECFAGKFSRKTTRQSQDRIGTVSGRGPFLSGGHPIGPRDSPTREKVPGQGKEMQGMDQAARSPN
jgi:hypothetical protein